MFLGFGFVIFCILLFWECSLLLVIILNKFVFIISRKLCVRTWKHLLDTVFFLYLSCFKYLKLNISYVCKLQYTALHCFCSGSFFSCPKLFQPLPFSCPLFYFPLGSWLQTPSPWPSYGSCGPKYLGLLYYMDPWVLNVFYFLSLMWLMDDGWWLCWLAAGNHIWPLHTEGRGGPGRCPIMKMALSFIWI